MWRTKKLLEKIENQKRLIKPHILKYLETIKNGIDKGHGKSTGMEIMELCANVLTIATYCSISPAIAEYQNIKMLYNFSRMAVVIMGIYAIWQIICLLSGSKLFWEVWNYINNLRIKAMEHVKHSVETKVVMYCSDNYGNCSL